MVAGRASLSPQRPVDGPRSETACRPRVLVLDDDEDGRRRIARHLEAAGFEAVGTAPRGLPLVARFDLLVLRVPVRREHQGAVLAHVRAALASTDERSSLDCTSAGPAGLRLEVSARRASVDGCTLELTPKAFAVLRALIGHRGRVLSTDDLALEVWGYPTDGSPNFVEAQISRLRATLTEAGVPDVIETVRGAGYVVR